MSKSQLRRFSCFDSLWCSNKNKASFGTEKKFAADGMRVTLKNSRELPLVKASNYYDWRASKIPLTSFKLQFDTLLIDNEIDFVSGFQHSIQRRKNDGNCMKIDLLVCWHQVFITLHFPTNFVFYGNLANNLLVFHMSSKTIRGA